VSLLAPEPSDSLWQRRFALCLELLSLTATGWFIWHAAVAPRWTYIRPELLIIRSVIVTLVAWGVSAGMTFVLFLLFRQHKREDIIAATIGTATTAVWFVPAMVLLSVFSPAAILAALILVVNATRILYSRWQSLHADGDLPLLAATDPRVFLAASQVPGQFLLRELAPGLTASFCLQAGWVAMMMRAPLLGAGFLAMTTAVLTIFGISAGIFSVEREPKLPRSIMGVLLSMLLAVGLTVGGMAPRLVRHSRSAETAAAPTGLVDTIRAFLRQLFYGPQPVQLPRNAEAPHGTVGGTSKSETDRVRNEPALATGGFPGVILWPELRPMATLIAPLPAAGYSGIVAPIAKPLSIPFSGEYWMYRWPYARPPRSSHFQRGSPAELSFKTTDRQPIQMEAYHRLYQTIDLECCRKIQVAIWNADRYPGTVSLELVLVNTTLPGTPSQSLGTALVASVFPSAQNAAAPPIPETLEFLIPANSTVREFDEFKIIFLRDRRRMDKSAKIAIDRFILVPAV